MIFLSALACLERLRRREGGARVFFWGVNGEGRRRLEGGGSSERFPILVSGVGDGKLVVESRFLLLVW